MMRAALLRMSRSESIERWVKSREFARAAVRRFMPGEELGDALEAAGRMTRRGLGIVLTELGENVTTPEQATAAATDYARALDRIADRSLDAEISVKPTHLGLDLGPDVARENVALLARAADTADSMVWVDMEDSSYVDRTLELVRSVREKSNRIGVCLQAYLHRTPDDLAALMEDPPVRVRLVKGAYREPPEHAIQRKKDVDERYHDLAATILRDRDYVSDAVPAFGTHDDRLIERIREFHMLYGIRGDLQEWLTAAGAEVRVLISYGAHWYPWYLRRLAERPANLWFVAKQLIR
ncbi:MAG: proline dehydrogenase family protein [Gemmatimonadota bacterium]